MFIPRSAVHLLIAAMLLTFVGCGAGEETTDSSSTGDPTAAVSVSPLVALPLPVGMTQQFSATAFSTSGTGTELDSGTTWASSDSEVATVDENGVVSGVAEGTASITATYDGVSSTGTAVVVTSAALESISLSIGNLSLASGLSLPITVTGHFSDGTTMDVTAGVDFSVDSGAASVSALGLVTGLAEGAVTVTATYGAFEETVDLTVTSAVLESISIQLGALSLAAGLSTPIQVVAHFSDDTSAVLTDGYTVSVTGAGSLVSGALNALTSGTATVNASYGEFDAAPVEVTVTSALLDSLSLELDTGVLPLGLTTQVKVFGHYSDDSIVELTSGVTLGSSNVAKVTVGAGGVVTAVSAGSANITASFGGQSTSLPITISSAVLQSISLAPAVDLTAGLPLGLTAQLVVTGNFSDASTQVLSAGVSFSSNTAALASVSSSGLITSLAVGSATIKASYPGVADATYTFTAADKTLVSITATPGTTSLSLLGGALTTTVTVTGTYSDASTAVISSGSGAAGLTFTSSSTGLLSVLLNGVITALGVGSDITVTASYGGFSDATPAISITLLP